MSIPSEIPDYVKMEDIGMEFRTKNFYIPLVKKLFGGGWNKRWNKNIKILDVGCGTGRVVKVLREACYEAYGIDLGLDSSPLKFFVYIFSPVVRHFFSSMEKINFLAKSPLNPFLNILIFRQS
jgi:SAM-dependent methyltransferase